MGDGRWAGEIAGRFGDDDIILEKTIDPRCPCTFLRLHADATVILEKSLADAIGYQG